MSIAVEEKVFLQGEMGVIEAKWWPSSVNDRKVVVICHPHPLYGGTMDNKVVTTLARTWRDSGYAVLRFNFRGVGKSEGVHDHGKGEQDDLQAVLSWLEATKNPSRIDLAGFSFGSWVAAAYTNRARAAWQPNQLVLVAPPVHYEGFDQLQLPANTWVIQGGKDDVVEPQQVKAWVASRCPMPIWCYLPEAEHFFHGQLTELRDVIKASLQ